MLKRGVVALSLLAALPACGDCRPRSSAGSRDASVHPVGRSWRSSPPAEVDGGLVASKFPRVAHRGGPFLRNPRIVTVTFGGDEAETVATLERFGDVIARTPWWRTVVDDYCAKADDCIGEGSAGPAARLGDVLPPVVRDTDVDEAIERAIRSGSIDVSSPDALLLVYLPPGVLLTDAYVARYCTLGPRAFHRSLPLGERKIPYAVVPRCGDVAATTSTASHELLEATTNPDPSQRGFSFESGSAYLGFTAAGLEPVDPCGLVTRDGHRTTESGFVVQRAWSNRQAALGHDPCVPALPKAPYLALVPRRPTVRLQSEGESVTLDVDAVADVRVPPWKAAAVDVTGDQDHASYFDLALDEATVERGARSTLTITLRTRPPRGLGIVGLVSTLDATTHMWPIAVVTR